MASRLGRRDAAEVAARRQYDRERTPARQRGYTRQWERVRAAWLRAHPLCERCQARGQIVAAVLVHHRQPGAAQAGDHSDLESLCQPCHEAEHAADRWRPRDHGPALRGPGLDGYPTDPRHPWAQAEAGQAGGAGDGEPL